MNILEILIIVLIIIITIFGIETIIKFKKSEGKLIDEIRQPLVVRINILMVLIVIISIITIINIVLKV